MKKLFLLMVVLGLPTGVFGTHEVPIPADDVPVESGAFLTNVLLRSITDPTTLLEHGQVNVRFNTSVYDAKNNKLFLGADKAALVVPGGVPAPKQSSLVSFSVNQKDGQYKVDIKPLAPKEGVLVNGAKTVPDSNPLYNKKIEHMAMAGSLLVAAVAQKIYLVSSHDGKMVSEHTATIQDANGDDIDKAPVALAGDARGRVVAAVPANGGGNTWQFAAGVNRGFAVLKPAEDGTKLEVINHGVAGRRALKLNLVPGVGPLGLNATEVNPVAFHSGGVGAAVITTAALDANVDIHYSEHFDKFFIGLQAAKKPVAEAAQTGGVVSVLVGTLGADNKLTIKPILHNASAALLPTPEQEIIGFYHVNQNRIASALKVRTMRTTTGRDYLIVVGGARATANPERLNSWVYALPLLPKKHANAGQLAKARFLETVPGVADVPGVGDVITVNQAHAPDILAGGGPLALTTAEIPYVVGYDPRALGSDDTDIPISDIMVDGDTVYVATDDDDGGMFASTAIFDADGIIVGWTRWQRVGGVHKAVFGFGFDSGSGSFQLLTSDDGLSAGDRTKIGSTMWGSSEAVRKGGGTEYKDLTSELAKIFPPEKGGIFKIFDFGPKTPGFTDPFSMLVVVGGNTVALIKSNDHVIGNWGVGQNIFVFTGDTAHAIALRAKFPAAPPNAIQDSAGLATIGPVTCAEVLRSTVLNQGYLYVGGFNGLARLQGVANVGWDPVAGLANLAIGAAPINNFDFFRIPGWTSPVFSIAADGLKLHVMSLDEVVVTGDVAINAPATRPAVTVKGSDVIEYGIDVVAIPRWSNAHARLPHSAIIAATTKGLAVSIDNLASAHWIEEIDGIPVKLVYIPRVKDLVAATTAGDTIGLTRGMLYVLTMDRNKDISKVYRFAVNVGHATPVADVLKLLPSAGNNPDIPFISYSTLRTDLATDGSVFFNTRSYNKNFIGFLRMHAASTLGKEDSSLHEVLGRAGATLAHMAAPVRDSYSGMWLVPGELRVNG